VRAVDGEAGATASRANSTSSYADVCVGRSDRPFPRPSKQTTRQWRARYGTCIFQTRECTTDHVGIMSTVGSPWP
jgi:hypothetical protein